MKSGFWGGLVVMGSILLCASLSGARADVCNSSPPPSIVEHLKSQNVVIGTSGAVQVMDIKCRYTGEYTVQSATVTQTPTADNVWGGECTYTCHTKILALYGAPTPTCDASRDLWPQTPAPSSPPACPKLPRLSEETKESRFSFSYSDYTDALKSANQDVAKAKASLCSISMIQDRHSCEPIMADKTSDGKIISAGDSSGLQCCYVGRYRGGAPTSKSKTKPANPDAANGV